MTVFHSGHLPQTPKLSGRSNCRRKTLSGRSNRRQKTFTAGDFSGELFRRRLFPTPTTPRGAAGGGGASPENVSRAEAWQARGGFSGSDAFEEVGDLLQALLLVWSVSEKDVAGKFAGKVAGGECFLTTIRLTRKRFLP